MNLDAIPAFARGAKFRLDEVRKAWVVLAPERLFLPDEQAVEILKLVNGQLSVRAIASTLAARFHAPHDVVAADVDQMLADLANKGVITFSGGA
jgi:pyrroloquinoline quinone biosynthesis protein D